jgi:hypothetical protein
MGVTTLVIAGALVIAGVASADEWNEKTILTFTEPVMIPDATLQPGTYVFKLADTHAQRNLVQVFKKDGPLVASTQAVPTMRKKASADVVVKFNPTAPGTPPAVKAWFYPGSTTGHEFVYPDRQARDIAMRTKTVVLSTDVPGSDLSQGTLYVYDASGNRADWQLDASVSNAWNEWRTSASGTSAVRTAPGTHANEKSTATAIQTTPIGTKVALDQLEDDPAKYVGQTITVDAEVEKVLGPHLFTIDEPDWIDLEGETLVYLPSNLAAMVHEGDRVSVSGTMNKMTLPELRREWGWLETKPETEARLMKRPLLLASRVVGGNSNVALLIDVNRSTTSTPVGTSGTFEGAGTISSASTISSADVESVGKQVMLSDATVGNVAGQGFWLRVDNGDDVFVLPASPGSSVHEGQRVSVDGVVLQMPRSMGDRLDAPDDANTDVYVYATTVKQQQ